MLPQSGPQHLPYPKTWASVDLPAPRSSVILPEQPDQHPCPLSLWVDDGPNLSSLLASLSSVFMFLTL